MEHEKHRSQSPIRISGEPTNFLEKHPELGRLHPELQTETICGGDKGRYHTESDIMTLRVEVDPRLKVSDVELRQALGPQFEGIIKGLNELSGEKLLGGGLNFEIRRTVRGEQSADKSIGRYVEITGGNKEDASLEGNPKEGMAIIRAANLTHLIQKTLLGGVEPMSLGSQDVLKNVRDFNNGEGIFSEDGLRRLSPVLTELSQVTEGTVHHHGETSLEHTLDVCKQLGTLLDENNVDRGLRRLVMAAGVLHDSGKPETRQDKGGGKVSFPGHAKVGTEKVRALFQDSQEFSENERKFISNLIKHHMYPTEIARQASERNAKRFIRRTDGLGEGVVGDEEARELLLLFAEADTEASQQGQSEPIKQLRGMVREIIAQDKVEQAEAAQTYQMTGNDLTNMGLEPGQQFGQILGFLKSQKPKTEMDAWKILLGEANRFQIPDEIKNQIRDRIQTE